MTDSSPIAAGIRVLTVPEGAAVQRVDRFVADMTGLSRSYVQRLISAGHLTADGAPLRSNAVVAPGATVRLVVPPPEPLALEPDRGIDVPVVYEDDDLLIVDKPAGLIVHTAGFTANGRRAAGAGGFTSGIGAAVARELVRRGATVAISARRKEQLQEVAGGDMLVLPADVTFPNDPAGHRRGQGAVRVAGDRRPHCRFISGG